MKFRQSVFFSILLLTLFPLAANATGIIKLDLSDNNGADFVFTGGATGSFETVDETTVKPGDQFTDVNYEGDLAALTDIVANASFSISGVNTFGDANLIGQVVVQETTGGTFSLWSNTDALLLTGMLTDGAISGSLASDTGSFFNVNIASFTGGSLLDNGTLAAVPAGISIALANIMSNGNPGMSLFLVPGAGNRLNSFTANGSVTLTGVRGTAIPEPMSMLLLLPGLAGISSLRKKQ